MNNTCDLCGNDFEGGFSRWTKPFNVRKEIEICHRCVCAIQTQNIPDGEAGIDITGTFTGDIRSIDEMIEFGYSPQEAKISIKCIGKAMRLTPAKIKSKLKRTNVS